MSEGLIPSIPVPERGQEFTKRMRGLLDGQPKDDETVAKALKGMDEMFDLIAAGLYSLASMLVGEGEESIRLVETAVANAEVSSCSDAMVARQSSRRALAVAALKTLAAREPGCLASPEAIAGPVGCIEDDELEAAGVTAAELQRMIAGPDRDRVREWLAKLPTGVRTVFALRAVAGFSASDTAELLSEYGAWTPDGVREIFRQGLCSLASQLVRSSF
jgi:hypothetical protein